MKTPPFPPSPIGPPGECATIRAGEHGEGTHSWTSSANKYIGELQRIECWAPGGTGGGSIEEIPVPAGLDYDLFSPADLNSSMTRDFRGDWQQGYDALKATPL